MDLHYLTSHWANVRSGLIETIAKFRDDELDFKPGPTLWTVRQFMLHIAYEEHVEFSWGIVQTLPEMPPEYDPRDYPNIAAIRELLASVHAPTVEYLKTLSEDDLSRVIVAPWGVQYRLVEMLGHLIEHEIHHRAELSLILGMLGRAGLDA